MLPKSSACQGCPLYGSGLGFSIPEGSGALDVLIVGEALGGNEERDGLPFRPYAEAGSVLERAIKRAGFQRDQFAFWNIVACRPPDNKLEGEDYEEAAINYCKQHFAAVVERFRPKVILALGNTACRTLTGLSGKNLGITSLRGFVLKAKDYPGVWVIPSFHPSFLRRGKMSYLGVLMHDIQLAVQVAREGFPETLPATYITSPQVEDAERFCLDVEAHPELPLAHDIETDYSHGVDENEVVKGAPDETKEEVDEEEVAPVKKHEMGRNIVLVQFSLRPGEGIAFPWIPQFIPFIKRLYRTPNRKLGFNNWHFDDPILAAHDVEILGLSDDQMWKYHHTQPDLPRGLQPVTSYHNPGFGPWKHTSGYNLAEYGCCDVDVLQRNDPEIERTLDKLNIRRGYERHVRDFWPILQGVSRRGLPISKPAQDKFRLELAEELKTADAELQSLYPDELRDLHPKNGYAKAPAKRAKFEAEGWKLTEHNFTYKVKSKVNCACVDPNTGEIMGWNKSPALRCPTCKGKGLVKGADVAVTGPRPVFLKPFKPSPKQLIRYMRWKGHPVPRAIGDKSKESTSKILLERLAKKTRDTFYTKLLRFRAVQKMKSAYVDAWVPDANGRLHATFSFSPATGQLAAFNPNVLTTPSAKLGEIGERFRETIAAPEGYVLGAFDFSGFHTATLALEAADPVYMRIAKLDPHSFLTAVVLKLKGAAEMLAMDDAELRPYLDWIKEKYKMERDKKSKPAILGIGFGLGAKGLYERHEENYASVGECKKIIDTIKAIFPGVALYQKNVRIHAAKPPCYLWNRHGFIRWFWDVVHLDPKTGEPTPGEQSEAAIAFNPACDAHGHIKDALIRLHHAGLLERYGLVNIVHDEGLFCWKRELTEEAIERIAEEMERPSEILRCPIVAPEGLSVAVEVKVGLNRRNLMDPKKFFAL